MIVVCAHPTCDTEFDKPESRNGMKGGRATEKRFCSPLCGSRAYELNRARRDWTADTLERHGSSRADYDRRLDAQGGGCAICGSTDPRARGGRFVVDHDHDCCPGSKSCGACIRGLLCSPCNVLLGMAHNDVKVIDQARLYLDRWSFVTAVA